MTRAPVGTGYASVQERRGAAFLYEGAALRLKGPLGLGRRQGDTRNYSVSVSAARTASEMALGA